MLILCVVERQQLSCHYAYGGGGAKNENVFGNKPIVSFIQTKQWNIHTTLDGLLKLVNVAVQCALSGWTKLCDNFGNYSSKVLFTNYDLFSIVDNCFYW